MSFNSTDAWGTAFWFWTTNNGGASATSSTSVLTNGDFGGTVQAINSMECTSSSHVTSFAQRLNYYCKAATSLSVSALLAFDDCGLMQSTFDTCAVNGGACSDCVVWTITASPSNSPTTSPSGSPSKHPTLSPSTLQPSKAPSTAPSNSPSSKAPSTSPTPPAPTKSPVAAPSSSPSASPSTSPSSSVRTLM